MHYRYANVTISDLLKKRCIDINKPMNNHGNMKYIGEKELDDVLLKINKCFDEIENIISPYVFGGCKSHD